MGPSQELFKPVREVIGERFLMTVVLAGTTVVEENVTTTENQNLQTDSEWSLGHSSRPSWWSTSSRDVNYGATMSNMIILDGGSSAEITAAENWLLAKYGERTPLESDEDATFFAELNLKVK